MYRCVLRGVQNTHQYEELIKIFLTAGEYEILSESTENFGACKVFEFKGDKNLLKREIYESLREYTGKSPKWVILTGIRPVKLTG